MFVRSLLIENFRSIKRVDISFQSRVTVLIGENGCGKSSILNALEAVLGRNVPKDGFDISVSDFHRNRETFYYAAAPSEDLQTKEMRIMIGFGGSFSGNKTEAMDKYASSEYIETEENGSRVLRADEASELYRHTAETDGFSSENESRRSLQEERACASYSSLQKFKDERFMTDLLMRGGRMARVLNFYLCVEARREGNQVYTDYHFEDAEHFL